ncbi:hypothetical protein N8D56_02470 [Devosia sp. A8/3-2]|nr:hypothetical protein N8D56_02470 [Devosia sp. A8/3-2]
MIDNTTQPEAKPGGEHRVDAGDHAGGEYRSGLDIDPEGQREPHGEVGDIGNQIIAQQMIKQGHRRLSLPARQARTTRRDAQPHLPAVVTGA